jgi:hypothetical protein
VRITSHVKAFSVRRAILKIAPRLALASVAIAAAAQTPTTWRYDLHPGDHLVYSDTLHREVRSDEVQSVVEAKFHTHVLIAGEHAGVLSAGFQRNQDSANLLVYRIKNKDKLAQERPNFEKRMQARPTQFSEAQEFTPSGEPRYSWEIVRESASHLLPDLHEINALPPRPVKTGERWPALDMLGMQFEWIASEQVHGKNCYRVSGKAVDGSATITYWWSPDSGVLERVELDGTYSVPGGTSHEQATLELESRSRNESASNWLGNSETRLATLDALLLSPWLPVKAEGLTSAMKTGNTAA